MIREIFYNFYGLNEQLFILINSATNIGSLPNILKFISQVFFIGNFAIAYVLVCIYFYCKLRKLSNPRETFLPIYEKLVKIGACYALFGLSYALLKFSFNLPRPFCSLPVTDFITILDTSKERCLSSFPSAHAGLSLLVAYFLWPYTNRILKILLCLSVTLVTTSRLTLAMHYPADILYGLFMVTFVINFNNYCYYKLQKILIIPCGYLISRLIFPIKNNTLNR